MYPVVASAAGQLSTVIVPPVGGVLGSFTQFGSCLAASTVLGDPQFKGLLGQSFQVHGIDGAVYSLIADRGMMLNARFVFLTSGVCPPASADTESMCWSHPGSYLGELAFVTAAGDVLVVQSGSAVSGFTNVTLNGRVLTVATSETVGELSVQLLSSHSLRVTAGNWLVHVENSDRFVNLVQVRPVRWSQVRRSHGLIGQTWKKPSVPGKEVKEIEGWVDDYAEKDGRLTGSAFGYTAARL